jgi:hypothetical protein
MLHLAMTEALILNRFVLVQAVAVVRSVQLESDQF